MEQVTNSFDSKEQDNQWHFEQGRREERKALLELIEEMIFPTQPSAGHAGWNHALRELKEKIQNGNH